MNEQDSLSFKFWVEELRKLGVDIEELLKHNLTKSELRDLAISLHKLLHQPMKIYLLKVDAGRDEEGEVIYKPVRAFFSYKQAKRIGKRDYPKPALFEIEEMEVEGTPFCPECGSSDLRLLPHLGRNECRQCGNSFADTD